MFTGRIPFSAPGILKGRTGELNSQQKVYSLENHHFEWVNQLYMAIFKFANCKRYQAGLPFVNVATDSWKWMCVKFEEIPSTFTSSSKTWHIMEHQGTVSSNVHREFSRFIVCATWISTWPPPWSPVRRTAGRKREANSMWGPQTTAKLVYTSKNYGLWYANWGL